MTTPTRLLEATSAGKSALSIMRLSRGGRIHSVYRGGLNVALSSGLISLVPESSGRGPLNVTIAKVGRGGMLSLGLEAGEPARVEGASLLLGDRSSVSLRGAASYSPSIRLSALVSASQLRRNLVEARKTGLEQGRLFGLGALLASETGRMADAFAGTLGIFSRAASGRIDSLVAAVRGHNNPSVAIAVSELVGLGPGLTPSSDDFLSGLALFLAIYSESYGCMQRASRAIRRAITTLGEGKTTALSRAYLHQAAAGRGNEAIMDVCKSLFTGNEEAVSMQVSRLVVVGETSGTDALLGLMVAGDLCLDEDRWAASW